MSDALPLPPGPNLERYKRLASDLERACKSSETDAIRKWAEHWTATLAHQISQEVTPEVQRAIHWNARRIEQQWQQAYTQSAECTIEGAQLFVARCHGFASWPAFASHVESLALAGSTVSNFEKAVDAIVNGDQATLETLLRENPDLVRQRSTREHRSTLLHYVAANGIEDFRQKTPANIVDIAKLLLAAGADVNAESDAYGGRSTTFGLAATSSPPEEAGLQRPLMELLINRGATIDGPDGGSAIVGCLRNGRGEAAEFLAKHGAGMDLEGAAGVGRLDVVMKFINKDGSVKPPSTPEQMKDGFAWACQFGRTEVVDFLLQRGMQVDTKLQHHGQTGLHWAAYGGHPDTVRLLLDRGASVDARDEGFNGTPLEWSLYAWVNTSPDRTGTRNYYEVVAQLVAAGAQLDRQWFEDNEDRGRAIQKLQTDALMASELGGAIKQ